MLRARCGLLQHLLSGAAGRPHSGHSLAGLLCARGAPARVANTSCAALPAGASTELKRVSMRKRRREAAAAAAAAAANAAAAEEEEDAAQAAEAAAVGADVDHAAPGLRTEVRPEQYEEELAEKARGVASRAARPRPRRSPASLQRACGRSFLRDAAAPLPRRRRPPRWPR